MRRTTCFAARLHDPTPEDFSRAEAATLIPKTNPLLRQMFQYIAMDTDDSIEWIVDDLVSLFAAVDVEKLMRDYGKDTQKSDPLLHFYEDFLAAYDPRLRKVRGVWNTPTPVVDFIVRAVDRILERDFALPGGLADLYGIREDKYAFLDANALESVKWQVLAMQEPYYFFVPKDFGLQEEYEKGFSIAELMHEQSMGSVSANDDLNISIAEHEQRDKIKDLLTLSEGDWRQKTGRKKDSRDWTYATARADAAEHGESVREISYRPFDNRFTCYTGRSRGLYSSPQQKIMSHFLQDENLGLCALRICSRDDSLPVFAFVRDERPQARCCRR